jgi:hypothetical protein
MNTEPAAIKMCENVVKTFSYIRLWEKQARGNPGRKQPEIVLAWRA